MPINSVRLLKTINVTTPTSPTTSYELVLEFANVSERDAFVAAEQAIEVNAHPPLHAKAARNERCALITIPKSDASTTVHKDTLDALIAYLTAKFPESTQFQGEIPVIEEQWNALSVNRTRSIIDREPVQTATTQQATTQDPVAPTGSASTPAPTQTQASTGSAPTPAPTTAPENASSNGSLTGLLTSARTRFTGLLNSVRAHLPSMPNYSELSIANLRARAQNLHLPTVEEVKQKAQSFIQAPSSHPVTLALAVGTGAFLTGFSFIGMLVIGGGVYAGTKLRDHLYAQPLAPATAEDRDTPAAFNAGREAGANWTAYFESFRAKNNWINALPYGKGLKQKMDEDQRNAQGNRLGQ